ncbi:MAG TPA: hypothetical protein VJM12_10780 [Pyrinomonadaceae bacterium]|nr:hypothetical protein [Pyrinomonadaceae bacterium]
MSTPSILKLMFLALALVAVFFPPVAEPDCFNVNTGQVCVAGLFPADPTIVEYQQPVPIADFTYENKMTKAMTFTIEWAGIDVAGSGNIHSVTLDPGASQSFSGITFTIPDSILEGTHRIAIGVTAQGGSDFVTVQRTFELVIVATGKVREVIQVPVRWCAVEGSPQAQGKLPGELVDPTRLLTLLQQVNNEVWLPQAGILFRHASAPFGIPVIKDPDPKLFDLGDITLTGFGGGEWSSALYECEQAWADLAGKHPEQYGDQRGTVLVNAKTLIPETLTTVGGVAPGVPYELWVASDTAGTGRRGDDLCGHPRKLLVSDVTPLLRAVTYDPAIFKHPGFSRYFNDTFKPVKVVSHELGHTLTLGHGNGLDDNGDGLAPPAPGRRRYDEYCDPLGEREDAIGFVDCDTSSSLMKANTCLNLRALQREMAREAAKLAPGAVETDSAVDPAGRLVAPAAACSPACTTAPSLELRTLDLAETPESAVTSFSHSIPEPIPSATSNRYLVYADLDNDVATGCSIAEAGLPAFQGAELRTEVTVSVTGDTATPIPQVWRCDGGAWVEQSDPGIVGSYSVLNAAVHDTTATPNGAVVTIRMPDAVRGPAETTVRLQALSQGGGQVDLLPSSGAGQTVSLIPPALPTCSVSPSIARPGQAVVVTASALPPSQTATLFVGEESTGSASSDPEGGLQTNVVVPATSPQGVRSIEARFQGVSAMCSVLVQGDAQTPATTASLSPPANSSGWNNTNVTVTLSAVDVPGGPGIRDITYSAAGAQPIVLTTHTGSSTQFIISLEGKTILQYYATNKDGVTEALHTLTISVDKTPPTITFAGNQQTYGILETVQITCAATDALSGVLSSTCKDIQGPAYQFVPSGNMLSATASDFAGNVTTSSTSFALRVTYDDVCSLGHQFVATSTRTPRHANVLGNSLCAHLSSARAAELRGHPKVKQRSIEAYVHQVMATSPVILTADQARILITLARAL